MICEKCDGKGFTFSRRELLSAGVVDAYDLCPDCGGSGIVSCCDPARGYEAWASLPEGAAEDILCYGMTVRKITKDGVERIPPEKWDANAIAAALVDQASQPEKPDEECPPPRPEPDAQDPR